MQASLAPPQTNLQPEIDFRRRLSRCQKLIEDSSRDRTATNQWYKNPAFHEVKAGRSTSPLSRSMQCHDTGVLTDARTVQLVLALQDSLSDLETAGGRR